MPGPGLPQAVSDKYGAQLPLAVDLSHGSGSVSYVRELSETRSIGWQFQASQPRMFALVRDRGLVGPGDELAAEVAEVEYADFVSYIVVEHVLGGMLKPKASNLGHGGSSRPTSSTGTARCTPRRRPACSPRHLPNPPPMSSPGSERVYLIAARAGREAARTCAARPAPVTRATGVRQ